MFLSLFATSRLAQQVVADFAVDALACVAVFTLQLHQCLRGERIGAVDAVSHEVRHDGIALSPQILQQFDGLVGHLVVAREFAVSVEQRSHRVDENDVDRAAAQSGGGALVGLAKGVVLGPIAAQLHLKECAHLLFALGLKNAVHHSESALDKLRQHGDAPIGEILRTNAEQFPRLLLHGGELEFVGEEGVFGAELVVVAVHSRLLGIEHTSLTEK